MKIRQDPIKKDNLNDFIKSNYRKRYDNNTKGEFFFFRNNILDDVLYEVLLEDDTTTFASQVHWAYNYKDLDDYRYKISLEASNMGIAGKCKKILCEYVKY